MESGSQPPPPPEGVAPPSQPAPLDADDTRGLHFKRLSGRPLTLSIGGVFLIGAFVGGTIGGGALIGAIAAVAIFLLILLIVWVLASNAAKEDFFSAYASARGLNRASGKSSLPPSTPLLRKGDRRYAEQVMNGTLPGGAPGALALYTFEVETTDSDGNRDTDYYRFTVVMHDIPSVAAKVADINCQRRSGFRFMDSAEDVFRRMKRLELESEVLDKNFEIFYGPNDDEVWMKQLFSPTFIVWMSEHTPEKFAWELSAGSLCCYVRGHYDNAQELDTMCKAAGDVASRLVTEAGE
ncbi:MAG: hypothetical protein U0R24_03200 [Solirubrobacterales bacterium]